MKKTMLESWKGALFTHANRSAWRRSCSHGPMPETPASLLCCTPRITSLNFRYLVFLLLAMMISSQVLANNPNAHIRVEALTNSLVGLNKAYQHASPTEKAGALDTLVNTAAERQSLLADLFEEDPGAVLRVTVPARVRAGMPEEVRAFIEQRLEIKGELEVLYEDYEDGSARLRHFLNHNDQRIELHFKAALPGLLSGTAVGASGVLLDGDMALESGESILTLAADGGVDGGSNNGSPAPVPNTFGEQSTAVLLVNFAVDQRQPWTVAEAHDVVFGTISDFFLENSYGQTWLNGDVFGWITIDIDPAGCPTTDISIQANISAGAQGIDLSGYNRIIYAFPDIGCSWSGQASVGGSYSWLDGTLLNDGIVSHELGHNFGLHHSHALECGVDVVGNNCLTAEYGDALDRMGSNNAGHFNAFQKSRLGWLDYQASPPIVTAESSGIYQLEPFAAETQGTKAIRILRDADPVTGQNRWYFLEFRQALGFDSFLATSRYGASVTNGLVFHLGVEGDSNSSALLDMTPNTQKYDWDDLALPVGESFSDATSGAIVTLDQIDASGATISIDFGATACVRRAPAVTLSPSQGPWVIPGTPVGYGVTVTSNDSNSCNATGFDLSAVAHAGWIVELDNSTLQIAPGASGSATMIVTSPPTENEGFYDITLTASENNDPTVSASATATYVIEPNGDDNQAPTVPTGLAAGETNKQVNLSWDHSSDNVGVTGYRVWRDGVMLADITNNSYSDRNIADNVTYLYTIDAYDAVANVSAQSDSVIAGKAKSKGGGKGKKPSK